MIVIVDGMGICHDLESFTRHPAIQRLPAAWRDDPTLAPFGTTRSLILAVKRRDAQTDDLVHALLSQSVAPDLATSVIVTAWLRTLIKRVGGDSALVDEMVAELTISVCEYRNERPDAEGLRHRILSRTWSRVRRRLDRERYLYPADPTDWLANRAADMDDPFESTLNRMEAVDLRDSLLTANSDLPWVGRAWSTGLALIDRPEVNPSEYNRLKYSLVVLRRHAHPVAA